MQHLSKSGSVITMVRPRFTHLYSQSSVYFVPTFSLISRYQAGRSSAVLRWFIRLNHSWLNKSYLMNLIDGAVSQYIQYIIFIRRLILLIASTVPSVGDQSLWLFKGIKINMYDRNRLFCKINSCSLKILHLSFSIYFRTLP